MNSVLQERLNRALDKWSEDHEYRSDCELIMNVASHHGLRLNMPEARLIWRHYSDTMCACWMDVDAHSSNEILGVLENFINRYSE